MGKRDNQRFGPPSYLTIITVCKTSAIEAHPDQIPNKRSAFKLSHYHKMV